MTKLKIKNMNIKYFIIIKDNSERLTNKNFKIINRKPLYYYLLNELRNEKVYIDTDSKRILKYIKNNKNIYKNFKAYPRNKNYIKLENSKKFKLSPVLLMVDNFIKNYCEANDIIVCTHVTSPFIKKNTINKAIKYLNRGYDTVSSSTNHYDFAVLKNKKVYKEINFNSKVVQKTQDLNPVILLNSAFFIFKASYFIKNKNRISLKHFYYEIKYPESIDINYPEDFNQAKDYVIANNIK